MFRFLFNLIFVSVIFLVGYSMGGGKVVDYRHYYLNLKESLTEKTRGMSSETSAVRIQFNLTDASRILSSVESDMMEKNFGIALDKLAIVKKRVDKAIASAPDTERRPLIEIRSAVEEIRVATVRFDMEAIGKIRKVINTIDAMYR